MRSWIVQAFRLEADAGETRSSGKGGWMVRCSGRVPAGSAAGSWSRLGAACRRRPSRPPRSGTVQRDQPDDQQKSDGKGVDSRVG